jgi:ABC-type sugar transport system substrate-binding protein
MELRKFGAAVVAAGCLLVAAGCGGDSNDSAATASGSGGSGSSGSSGKKYNVGIVAFAAADQTSSQAIAGYKARAAELGYKVTVVDPQGSVDKAVGAMQDLVQKRVDLMMVTVFPSTALTAGLRAAKAAGIPVVSLSGGLADGVQVNYDSGIAAGKKLADELVKETGGSGDLLALGYKSGLPCIGREKSLDAALQGTSIAKSRQEVPIPGQVEASTQFTQAFLAKHKSGGIVWGCFDDPSLGAIAAIKQAGRKDVKVYGINGQPAALKAIQDKAMNATVWLDVTGAGKEIADNTAKYVDAGVDAKPVDTPVPDELVTQDNVDAFLKAHPDAIKGL